MGNTAQPDIKRSLSVIKLQENIFAAGPILCAKTIGNDICGNFARFLNGPSIPAATLAGKVTLNVRPKPVDENSRSLFIAGQSSPRHI